MSAETPKILTIDEICEWSVNTQGLPPDHDMVRALYTIKALLDMYDEILHDGLKTTNTDREDG